MSGMKREAPSCDDSPQPSSLNPKSSGRRRVVPPHLTTAYMTQSIMPQHANTLGITFGGQVSNFMCMHDGQLLAAARYAILLCSLTHFRLLDGRIGWYILQQL